MQFKQEVTIDVRDRIFDVTQGTPLIAPEEEPTNEL
jgi:hypothetical protein